MARISAGRILPGGLVVPPAPKVWLGADDDWNFTQAGGCLPGSTPHAGIELDCMLGRRMAIRRRHYPFTNGPSGSPPKFSWPTANETADTNLTNPRAVPFISHGSQGSGASGFPIKNTIAGQPYSNTTPWTSPGGTVYHGIDIITGGKFDTAYTDAFTRIKNLNYPVFFNLYPEMNIQAMGAYGGYQGGVGGAGEAAFIACWRHLHGLAASAGATNMIWCYGISYDTGSVHYDPEGSSYYPGDAYVDMVGLDLYRHNFSGNVDFIYNFSVAHQKPFGILENGYDAGAGKAAFVNELHTSILLPKYVETVALIPWNFPGTGDEHIDTDPATLANYQAIANDTAFDTYYLSGGSTDSAPLNSIPPSLNDTSPAQSELISITDGQWTGSPTPSLTDMVQEAPNGSAAFLQPLAAYGMGGQTGPPPPPPPPPRPPATAAVEGGGYVNVAYVVPSDPSRVLLGGDVHGSYLSTDLLRSIIFTDLGITGPVLTDRQVSSFGADTANPDHILKVTKGNVWESTDRGVTWTSLGGDGLVGSGGHPRGCGRAAAYLADGTRVTLHDQTTNGIQTRAPAAGSWTNVAGWPGAAPQCLVQNPSSKKQFMVCDATHVWRIDDITAPTYTLMTGLAGAYEFVFEPVNGLLFAVTGQTVHVLQNPWGINANGVWRLLYTGDTNFGGIDAAVVGGTTYLIAGGNPYNTSGHQVVIRGKSTTAFLGDTGTWDSPRSNWDSVINGSNLTWHLSDQDGSAQALTGSAQSMDTALLSVDPTTGKLAGMVFGHAGAWITHDFTITNPIWHPAVNGLGGGIDRDVRWDIRMNGAATLGLSDHGCIWSSTGLLGNLLMLKTSHDSESIAQDPSTHDLFIAYDDGTVKRYSDPVAGAPTETDQGFAQGTDKNSNAVMRDGSNNLIQIVITKGALPKRKVGAGSPATIASLPAAPGEKRNQLAVKHSANLIAAHVKGVGVYVSTDFGATFVLSLTSTAADDHAGSVCWDPLVGRDLLYYANGTTVRRIAKGSNWAEANTTVTDVSGTLPASASLMDIGPNGNAVVVTRATSGLPIPKFYTTFHTNLATSTPAWVQGTDTALAYANRGAYPTAISVNATGDALVCMDGMGVTTLPWRGAPPPPVVPAIASFTPTHAVVGTSVVITGTGFTGATTVSFHSTAASAFSVDSGTQITATVNTGTTTGTISVTSPTGTGTSSGSFTVDSPPAGGTTVDVTGTIGTTGVPAFRVNGTRTHAAGAAAGLLLNTRLVNAIFDDQNSATRTNWNYPGAVTFDRDRQATEFIDQISTLKSWNLDAVTVCLQGGRPVITSSDPQAWDNTPWNTDGSIPGSGRRGEYWTRLDNVLTALDSHGLVTILQFFYFGQVNRLTTPTGDDARNAAMDNTVDWLLGKSYRNILFNLANEAYHGGISGNTTWAGTMFASDAGCNAACDRVRNRLAAGGWTNPLVGLTFGSALAEIPSNSQVAHLDWVGLQDNSWSTTNHRVQNRANNIRALSNYIAHPIPILVVEDNSIESLGSAGTGAHDEAVTNHVSTGYFEKGAVDGDYNTGWQTVPTPWGIRTGNHDGGLTGSLEGNKDKWRTWLAAQG